MEHSQHIRIRYVATQLAAALEKSQLHPRFGIDFDLPNSIRADLDESRVTEHIDHSMLVSYVTIMWVYYLHPQYFTRTVAIYPSMIRLARLIHHFAHHYRVGDKQTPLEQFTWMFLAEFDAPPSTPPPNWASELDGVCLYNINSNLLRQLAITIPREELNVYSWPSYHSVTLRILGHEIYQAIGYATAPLDLHEHAHICKQLGIHLQVAHQPHIRILVKAYFDICAASEMDDPEYLTRRALYRMRITSGFTTYTAVGRAIRQHEFVSEFMQARGNLYDAGAPSLDGPDVSGLEVPGPEVPPPPPQTRLRLQPQVAIDSMPQNLIQRFNGVGFHSSAADPAEEAPPSLLRVEIPPLDISAITYASDSETPPRRHRRRDEWGY
jgi:hypothetical protein